MSTKTKAWTNLVLLLATLGVNFMGATGLINGSSQAEISARYQTLITPAGFAFSIWSVIYTLLLVSTIVMIIKYEDRYYAAAINEIAPLFWLTLVFNMLWIISFSYLQLGISTIFIFAYVLTLAMILRKLLRLNQEQHWLLPLTFGLLTGWLFVATVVNVAAYLVQIEWNGFGIAADMWAAIILSVSVVLALLVLLRVKNAVFPISIAWAYWGINRELSTIGEYPTLEIIALAGMAVLLALAAYTFFRNSRAIIPTRRMLSKNL